MTIDANTYFTKRHLADQEAIQRRIEDFHREHFCNLDIEDLTEALACHSKSELIDAFRKADPQRFYSATLAAVTEMLKQRALEE